MNTVFKVGMKVYDEINHPGVEGIVVDVFDLGRVDYPVDVDFGDRMSCYTPCGRIDMELDTKHLSTTPYKVEFIGFSQERPFDEDDYKGKYVMCWDEVLPSEVHVGKYSRFEDGQHRVSCTRSGYDAKYATLWDRVELLTDEQVEVLKTIGLL